MHLDLSASRSAVLLTLFALMLVGSHGVAQAATLTVTNTDDNGTGSLRQAIADASPGDTIDFSVTGTITLTSGELVIAKDLTISGPGAANLAISGNNASRVIRIVTGEVSISGVTIQDGSTTGNPPGGGIYNLATLILANSTVSGNSVSGLFPGGGIGNDGVLTVTDSTISGNTSAYGGGIYSNTTLTISNSTISNNIARELGGGCYCGGIVTIDGSNISGNSANLYDGGGLYFYSAGTQTVTNSTVSGNSTVGKGGGIFVNLNGGVVTVVNSTVTGNSASSSGGGIHIREGGSVESVNSIISGNTAATGPDCGNLAVFTSLGYNLIGDDTGCGYTPATGDLVGDGANPIDPLLGPLQDNGGPTFTHALMPGSPAIDAGSPATPGSGGDACLATDQRGVSRPQGTRCDIGAFEVVQPYTCGGLPATIVGTPGNDIIFGTPGRDVIVGLAGHDIIDGLAGDDVICAGPGSDVVDGGDGNDKIWGQRGVDVLSGGLGDDRVFGNLGMDFLFGNQGNDKLFGGSGPDWISGGAGNDAIFGNRHNDHLAGGSGDDRIYGGLGDGDACDGGPETDFVFGCEL